MNNILKNLLVGVAVAGVCFGIGYGTKLIINHDWNHKTEGLSVIQLERKINQLERELDDLFEQNRRNGGSQDTRLAGRIDNLEDKYDVLSNRINHLESTLRNQMNRTEKRVQELNLDRYKKLQAELVKSIIDSQEKRGKADYDNKSCNSQADCGGKNSGYFCNYGGMHSKDVCEKTNEETIRISGTSYYYNNASDLKRWCRTATESAEDRAHPENCNWGYLSYSAAQAWCESIGKELVDPDTIQDNCEDFDFLPTANPDQTYWTRNMNVVHMGDKCSVQRMIRGDGYCAAAGVICK